MNLNSIETWCIFLGFFLFGSVIGACMGAYLFYRITGNVVAEAEQILVEETGG